MCTTFDGFFVRYYATPRCRHSSHGFRDVLDQDSVEEKVEEIIGELIPVLAG